MADIDPRDRAIAEAIREWADALAAATPSYRHSPLEGVERRRLRRPLAVAVAVVLMVAGVVGIAWARSGRDHPEPAANTTPPGPPPTADSTPVTATATGASVDLTVTVPTEVFAGTRLRIDIVITNHGPDTIYRQAGGCGTPAEVTVGPAGAPASPLAESPRLSSDQLWGGDPDDLADAIRTAADHADRQLAVPEEMTGWTQFGCPAISVMEAIEPGRRLTDTMTTEIRVPPGPLPADGSYSAVATFVGYATADGYPAEPLDQITAVAEFAVIDHPARTAASTDDIAEAIIADGRLTTWHATTVIPGRADLDQRHQLALTWWRDTWELWDRPFYGNTDAIRVRVEPATLTVTDARVVVGGTPPDDEPDIADHGAFPDRLLPPPGSPEAVAPGATANPATARPGDTIAITTELGQICDGLVLVYRRVGDNTRETGLLLTEPEGATWHTAPEHSPITIPPCEPVDADGPVTVIVPQLGAGKYLICLTRESDACAALDVL